MGLYESHLPMQEAVEVAGSILVGRSLEKGNGDLLLIGLENYGQRILAGHSHGFAESDMTEAT